MPHARIEDRRKWEREYRKRRKNQGDTPDLSCERAIINAIAERPAELDCPALYWTLNQRWSYRQIQNTVKTLLGDDGNGGVLEYDRATLLKERRKVLALRNVPTVTPTPPPAPAMTENRG